MGEMLAECRCVACLLGDTDRDPALGLVRDRERLFFFFSCGLLEGERGEAGRSAGPGGPVLSTAGSQMPFLLAKAVHTLTRN